MEDLTTQDIAKNMINKFYNSDMMLSFTISEAKHYAKWCANYCIDVYIKDLVSSMQITREMKAHLHAEGLIAGMIITWKEVRVEINKL